MQMTRTLRKLAHVAVALLLGLLASPASAQVPGDVDGMDMRLIQSGPTQLEVQVRANNDWDFSDGLFNTAFCIRWQTAAGGTLVGNSSQSLDDCFNDGARLLGNPGIVNRDSLGFRYRGYSCIGAGWADGDGCVYPGNTWIPYARINVTALTGCTTFEIVQSDFFTIAKNSN